MFLIHVPPFGALLLNNFSPRTSFWLALRLWLSLRHPLGPQYIIRKIHFDFTKPPFATEVLESPRGGSETQLNNFFRELETAEGKEIIKK